MKRKIIWAEPARDELLDILIYIARDNLAAAENTVRRIEKVAGNLAVLQPDGRVAWSAYTKSPSLACQIFWTTKSHEAQMASKLSSFCTSFMRRAIGSQAPGHPNKPYRSPNLIASSNPNSPGKPPFVNSRLKWPIFLAGRASVLP